MNCLTIEVSDGGMRFFGGALDGRRFEKGDAIFVQGENVWFGKKVPSVEALECGFWVLHCTIHRGRPAVICSFFNKRTQHIEERYYKVFYYEGIYRCGPRFPRMIQRLRHKPARLHEKWKEAA